MRFNEEIQGHRGKAFRLFQDPMCRWWVEIDNRRFTPGFSFERGFDSTLERKAAIEDAHLYIDHMF